MKYTLGIDLGGTNIAAGIVDENYNILIKGSRPTLAKRPPEEIAADIINRAGIEVIPRTYLNYSSKSALTTKQVKIFPHCQVNLEAG